MLLNFAMIVFFLVLASIFYLFPFFLNMLTSSALRPSLPPGPTPLPYIGSVISMLRNKPTFRWIHRMMDEMNTKILCVRLGNVHVIAVSDPKIALEFLKDTKGIFSSRPDTMSAYLASGGYLHTALAPMGDQWKMMKRVLTTEVFSVARHKWLLNKRNEEHDHIMRYIKTQCDNKHGVTRGVVVNMRIIAQQYTSNMARKLIFGSRYFGKGSRDGGPGDEEMEHVESLRTITSYVNAFCVMDYFPWLRWVTDFDGHEKAIRNAVITTRKYQDPLIDKRLQQWKDGIRTNQEDLLDVLINLKNPQLNIDEIKAEILDISVATFDNTSNNIEWVMAEMINDLRILNKAVHELDLVVGKDRLVKESDIKDLNYIKSCIKETFRLHPVSPFNLPHLTTADSIVAGYFIPKGSHVIVSRLGLGRNPIVWDDPLTFNPDRHMSSDKEVMLTDNNLHTFSFSTGRRGCPAVLLGSTITTMLVARLVQGFSWDLPFNEQHIDLDEKLHDLAKANPLIALAKPRLAPHLYCTS